MCRKVCGIMQRRFIRRYKHVTNGHVIILVYVCIDLLLVLISSLVSRTCKIINMRVVMWCVHATIATAAGRSPEGFSAFPPSPGLFSPPPRRRGRRLRARIRHLFTGGGAGRKHTMYTRGTDERTQWLPFQKYLEEVIYIIYT